MQRFANNARSWQALLTLGEARLARARHRAAAAARTVQNTLDTLHTARLALAEAERRASECRRKIDGEQHGWHDFQRGDLERIRDTHTRLDHMIENARAAAVVAATTHDEACRLLGQAQSAHGALMRRCEKYRFALNRLTCHDDDDAS
jgi:hypothetical protein